MLLAKSLLMRVVGNGYDPTLGNFAFGSTGRTEDDILAVYEAPWVNSKWTEAGKRCMFYCGIEPPQPKALMEDYPVRWDERAMRRGAVVFEPTPVDLKSTNRYRFKRLLARVITLSYQS